MKGESHAAKGDEYAMQKGLSQYRDELKGLAILGVVFFHARLGLTGFWYGLQQICYGGVDVFLFLSGFGLYHSLERSGDVGAYLKRRAMRLLPSYLPFCFVWLCVMIPLYDLGTVQSVRMAAGNLFLLGFFADVPMVNWYMSAVAITLLLAPIFHAALRGNARSSLHAWLVPAVCFGLGLCFIGKESYMVVARLPIFALGMLAARPVNRPLEKGKRIALGTVSFAVGMGLLTVCFRRFPDSLNTYGMYWHPFVLIVPPLCAGLCGVMRVLKCEGRAFAPLRFLGRASFEIFLFNAWAEVLCKKFGMAPNVLSWVLWSLGSIAVGCGYHWVVTNACKRVQERRKMQKVGL